jgi:uncharacterized protein YjbI with pentapeptide repeats
MANPEHLKILEKGIEAWNQWRKEYPDLEPDLSEADLSIADQKTLTRRLELLDEVLKNRGQFRYLEVREPFLHGPDLRGVDFRGSDLHGASVRSSDLRQASLCEANLREADLSEAMLCHADLHDAYLRDGKLHRADLTGACLSEADLTGADLTGARLGGTILTGAQAMATAFSDIDLSLSKGLESIRHYGPSTVGIDTIYRSKGNIPEAFLRGAGVPQDFITYMKSLVSKAIDFYSCFISYSSKDDDFAQRLHADLQQKGVRCWFAPEHLKIGEKFRMRIDESIRIYDKLMVILSENSIRSSWVEEEVEAALEKERRQNKLILFPIRLDDAVMETDQAWAASLRRMRHIGDFRAWKDHDQYQKSFERLLRDLKAKST